MWLRYDCTGQVIPDLDQIAGAFFAVLLSNPDLTLDMMVCADQDPLPDTFNYNDGDLAPLGAPDGVINTSDVILIQKMVLGGE